MEKIFLILIFIFFKSSFSLPIAKTQPELSIVSSNTDGNCPKIEWSGLNSGALFSPNFPANYPNDANCSYYVTCPVGSTVTVVFEVVKLDTCCDSIYIYEGSKIDSNHLLGHVTGSPSKGLEFSTTSSNIMTILFVSDENFVDQGFYAVFSVTDTLTDCIAQPYDDQFGVIVSPLFPAEYPVETDCGYLIGNGQEDTIVILTINNFSTEACCDKVFLYDGQDSSSRLLKTLSGTIVSGTKFYSTGPFLFVRFLSDATTGDSGYSITYEIVTPKDFVTKTLQVLND